MGYARPRYYRGAWRAQVRGIGISTRWISAQAVLLSLFMHAPTATGVARCATQGCMQCGSISLSNGSDTCWLSTQATLEYGTTRSGMRIRNAHRSVPQCAHLGENHDTPKPESRSPEARHQCECS
jgi:hypothetical protein